MGKNGLMQMWETTRKWFRERLLGVDTVIASAAAAYEAAALVTVLGNHQFTKLDFLSGMSKAGFWIVLIVVFALLLGATVLTRSRLIPSAALTLFTVVFASVLAMIVSNIWFNIGLLFVAFLVARYVSREDKLNLERIRFSFRTGRILVWCGTAVFAIGIGYATACKYLTYSVSSFDFGIFAQMFEQMAKTGLPLTTVERSTELSHFAVHFSPAYYLLLPGYLLFRSPLYLSWVQALVVSLGAPLVFGIARKLKLSPMAATACSFLYLLYPSMSNGCFYDFHENKLLPVCILLLLYFLLEKQEQTPASDLPLGRRALKELVGFLPALGGALLVLSVKEDAAIFVFAVALWVIFTQKRKWRGIALFALGAVWFVFALGMIRHLGGEVMISRLTDYYPAGEEGFLSVIRTCFYDIGYVFSKVFVADKLAFVLWMLVPVAVLPFLCRKSATLVLLLPMLVVNLMPSWQYQYNVDYQYTFGPGALILFAAVWALSEMKPEKRRGILLLALMTGFIFTASLTFPKIGRYMERYQNGKDTYQQASALLEEIPRDASVTVNAFLMPHLYDVEEVYTYPDYYPANKETKFTDYYVVDTRYADNKNYNMESICEKYYELVAKESFVEIWKLKEGVTP